MKRCWRCGLEKPLSEFYKDARASDGKTGRCKSCAKEHSRKWHRANPDKKREARRKWQDANTEKFYAAIGRWRVANPEKVQAWYVTRRAISRGDLVRPKACDVCGETASIDAHHDDYSQPLDIRWLCRDCHAAHHASAGETKGFVA